MDFYNVFVYGTLRKRGTNHHIISHALCLHTRYVIRGYCLYDYERWYPYMIRGEEDDQVVGEVYRVDQRTLRQLDVLEDVANKLYKLIYLPSHQCHTYIKYDEEVAGLQKIKEGDWIKYIKSLKIS